MMIKIYGLLLLFIPALAFGQDLSGKWSGTLSQGRPYVMEINISQFGKVINGTSRFTGDEGDFVEMRFTGTINGTTVTLNENEVSIIPYGLSCALKNLTGHFRIDSLTKDMVIEGTWTSSKVYENKQYHPVPLSSVGTFKVMMGIEVQIAAKKAKMAIRPLDGYFKKENIPNAKIAPLAVLNEKDVVFSRRIWREIDLREKNNQFMIAPKGRLIDALMDAVADGELTAYDPTSTKDDLNGDQFSSPLTPEKAKLKMADSSVVNIIDKKTGDRTGSKMVAGEYNPDSVLRFRIKEDEFFDKQRSVYEYRIIGIAPMVRPKVDGAKNIDYQPAFWIYFPAARKVLAQKEVVNNRNDAPDLSYDDIFTKRLFTSYVVKESNEGDEFIKYHAQGIDRLKEADKIRKTLMDWELNLWQ